MVKTFLLVGWESRIETSFFPSVVSSVDWFLRWLKLIKLPICLVFVPPISLGSGKSGEDIMLCLGYTETGDITHGSGRS